MGQREQTLRALAELQERFDDVKRLVRAAGAAYGTARRRGRLDDEIWRRALGSYLHDFYCAVENLFRSVTYLTGEGLPRGGDWHRRLLDQMVRPVQQVRPALLSAESHRALGDYLAFCHVFRNVDGFQLDSTRLQGLLQGLPDLSARLEEDFRRFEDFVRGLAARDPSEAQS